MSEDWGFIVKSRVIGIEAYADPTIRLNHSGTFVFPGDPTGLYNSMGLKVETSPHLMPRIAMRKDEISDDSAKLVVQPDLKALEEYTTKKTKEEAEKKLAEAQAVVDSLAGKSLISGNVVV